MKAGRKEWEEQWQALRRGWLAQVSQKIGPNHFGEERRESAEQKVARIISEESAKCGLNRPELLVGATTPTRLQVAKHLRAETTPSQQ